MRELGVYHHPALSLGLPAMTSALAPSSRRGNPAVPAWRAGRLRRRVGWSPETYRGNGGRYDSAGSACVDVLIWRQAGKHCRFTPCLGDLCQRARAGCATAADRMPMCGPGTQCARYPGLDGDDQALVYAGLDPEVSVLCVAAAHACICAGLCATRSTGWAHELTDCRRSPRDAAQGAGRVDSGLAAWGGVDGMGAGGAAATVPHALVGGAAHGGRRLGGRVGLSSMCPSPTYVWRRRSEGLENLGATALGYTSIKPGLGHARQSRVIQ
jgi:hypothetical protein